MDSTSLTDPVPASPTPSAPACATASGLRVGVVRELHGDGYQAGVRARFDEAVALLTEAGAEVVEGLVPELHRGARGVLPHPPSEASSNLAKFDAMRYGLRVCRTASTSRRPSRSWPPRARPASATR
jgi:aspartyl-tRNA(Asn)/glutamyl-tRNA(Gln) amidotransferase subunit A